MCLCGCVQRLRQENQAEWEKTCRLMSSPHGKKSQLLFLSVNHPKWLLPLVLMTLGLYTNETKGFVKDPNRSGSGDVATSDKHTANEPQRALSAQQGENYNVIPTFNIITIFIALLAGQEQACCIVSSQSMWISNSLSRRDEFQNIHIISLPLDRSFFK